MRAVPTFATHEPEPSRFAFHLRHSAQSLCAFQDERHGDDAPRDARREHQIPFPVRVLPGTRARPETRGGGARHDIARFLIVTLPRPDASRPTTRLIRGSDPFPRPWSHPPPRTQPHRPAEEGGLERLAKTPRTARKTVRPRRTGQSTFSFRAHEIFLRRIARPIPRRSSPSLDAPRERRLTTPAFIISNRSAREKTTTTTTRRRCVLSPASRFAPPDAPGVFSTHQTNRPLVRENARATRTPADEKCRLARDSQSMRYPLRSRTPISGMKRLGLYVPPPVVRPAVASLPPRAGSRSARRPRPLEPRVSATRAFLPLSRVTRAVSRVGESGVAFRGRSRRAANRL